MKKIGAFLLTLASCVALASCGKKTTTPTTTAPTTTVAPETPTYTYKSKSYSEVTENLGSKVELHVSLPYSMGNTYEKVDVTLAVSGNKVIISSPEGKVYFKEIDGVKTGNVGMFMDDGVNAYDKVYVVPASTVGSYIDFEEALSIACGLDITYNVKDENFDFIGRKCTQYLHSYKDGSKEVTEEYVIDNTTGMCLKHSINKSSEEVINDTTFEVTDFKLGNNVDDFFKAADDNIIVAPWDTKFLGDHGLQKHSPYSYDIDEIIQAYDDTENLPTIYFDSAASPYYEGVQYACETSLILDGTDKQNSDFAVWVIANIYGCGAKYDYTGSETGMFDLWNTDYDSTGGFYKEISFNAFSNQTVQYAVNVTYETRQTLLGEETVLTITLINLATKPDDVSVDYKTKSVEEIVENLGNTYKINVKLPDEAEMYDATIAYYNGNMIMYDLEGSAYFENKSTTEYYVYIYNKNVGGYTSKGVYSKEGCPTQYDALDIACGLDITYTSIQTEIQFLGRLCTKFVNVFDDNDVEITEEYIIDNITGICLKHAYSSNNSPIIMDDSLEVTSFVLTGEDVNTYFEDQKALIKIKPWDDSFMEDCGFENVLDSSDKIIHAFAMEDIEKLLDNDDINFDLMYAYNYYTDDGEMYGHEVYYKMEGDTDINRSLYAMGIATNLGFCGINYDSAGHELELDEDYTKDCWTSILEYSIEGEETDYILLDGFNDSEKTIRVIFTYYIGTAGTSMISMTVVDVTKSSANQQN